MANPTAYKEFLMVSTKTDDAGVSDYYVGVPSEPFLAAFDGFERVSEGELPKEIGVFHLGDSTKEPFTSRFRFRSRS
jgi:hypothetical protein